MASKGYFIKARKIKDSQIAHCAPVVREIWDYLLREANYLDNEKNGIKRGQLFTSYAEMIEDLHWYVGYRKVYYTKTQCEKAMKTLTKMHMTTTTKTTRGLVITICKYDTYQDPKNYEDDTEDYKKTTRRRKGAATILEESKESKEGGIPATPVTPQDEKFIKFQEWVATNAPRVSKMQMPFTQEQFEKLAETHSPELIKEYLLKMQNWRNINNNTSAYLTILNWMNRDKKDNMVVNQQTLHNPNNALRKL